MVTPSHLDAGTAAPPWPARLAVAFLGVGSVLSLLAWVYGIWDFAWFFLAVSLPLTLAMVGTGVLAARRTGPRWRWWREVFVAGVLGGIVGSLGYDLFRVPFVLAGFRVLAPIDSYGVLLLGADTSSAFTGLVGWGYHFLNGVGFAITYVAVAKGRSLWWGVAWALVLETATIITPFADSYALRGKWVPIAIAYAAHVPYGLALGWFGRHAQRVTRGAEEVRYPITAAAGALVIGLVLWQRPFAPDPAVAAGRSVAPGPSTMILGQEFVPEWLRVPVGGCAAVGNGDDIAYQIKDGPVVEPGAAVRFCPEGTGVHRVRLLDERGFEVEHSGGFVITDPELG